MFTKIAYSFIFLLCCVGLGVSVFYALQEPSGNGVALAGADLQPDTDYIEIGAIRQQETKDATFQLRNVSQNELSLESVHTSCGCTDWKLDKRQLKSGETAELSVTFSSGSARNKVAVMVRVFYKNLETEKTGNLFLNLIADIQPDYDISPSSLNFTEESEVVQSLSLKPYFAEDIKILDVSCTRNYYDVEIVKADPIESVVKVTFLKEKKLPGEKNAILELKTSSQRHPVCRVFLTCDP